MPCLPATALGNAPCASVQPDFGAQCEYRIVLISAAEHPCRIELGVCGIDGVRLDGVEHGPATRDAPFVVALLEAIDVAAEYLDAAVVRAVGMFRVEHRTMFARLRRKFQARDEIRFDGGDAIGCEFHETVAEEMRGRQQARRIVPLLTHAMKASRVPLKSA